MIEIDVETPRLNEEGDISLNIMDVYDETCFYNQTLTFDQAHKLFLALKEVFEK